MADNSEVAAIIGGSIGGLIVFVIIVSIIIYMLCGSRNRRKRQEKKFHQVSRHHDKVPHSQNSTMSHLSAERLPKVGSNGLWMGTPGVYAASPSPAYFYGRPYPPGVRTPMENRMQAFPGHAVYQSNNSMSNLRIYHSQQLSPVYEYIDPTHGPNVVDIYQYGDLHHSRSRLIDQQSSSWKKQKDKNDKKILRSKSDATQDVRRHEKRGRSDTNRSSETRSSSNSKSGKSQEARADIHISNKGQKSKSTDAIHMGYDNKAFQRDSGLATDSMKLQATKVNPINNITDDEKKHVNTPQDKDAKIEEPVVSHYTYQGDIYAVSDKNPEASNNPILDKMNSMKLETPNVRAPRYLVEDTVDGLDVQVSRVNNSARQEVDNSDTIYTEVRSNVGENIIVTEILDNNEPDTMSHDNNSNNNALLQPQPSTSHNLLATSPSLMSEKSELSEDLDVKGKNVTTAAFEFLESYLSDDDETTGESRPTSPAT
ncbi:hypothetical protein LOTGIDRAFT_230124 [Lottia gigantea]|uniref:Uncharacterized protein n=1 Tax=Lottia gigantea TaxID=225164 RepID=V4AI93_LOTGI|nr:hypothetical protein LOTGIDRAFT_230124 [Lottia gigantea]ESP03809.1 hypothetical protein LOTGIDRAFT_230124 [Lottia gigantea]